MKFTPNPQQREGFARVCDSLASLSIASFVVYLTGHLDLGFFEANGLGLAILVTLSMGYYFRRTVK